MARRLSSSAFLLFFLAAVLAALSSSSLAADSSEPTTTFKLYLHDVVSGAQPTAVRIAEAPSTNASRTYFGRVMVMDDPVTTGPDRASSPEIGRAQGTYTFADQRTMALLVQMNFVFTAGEHNGSSLAILGRNEVGRDVREMGVVVGTGKFRMARGYVLARTVDAGVSSGEAVVEYTVNVLEAAA